MNFLLCSTDESIFEDYIVNQFPVVGIAERFVLPDDCFITPKSKEQESPEMVEILLREELEELGITLHAII